jgi:hypothetical protein
MFNEYAIIFTLLTIYTIALHFWTDIRELKVDSRRNYMMYGAILVIGLISHQTWTLIITGLLTLGFMIILGKIEEKQGKVVFGDGDKEILGWSIPGIALVFDYGYAALFVCLLMISFISLAYLRHAKAIDASKLPGLIFIAFAYIIVLLLGWFL